MNFTVYKSSAGSGKTYTLVKEYLKIALCTEQADNYRGILAITFTNKAASEMKERVFLSLKSLSSDGTVTGTAKFLLNDLINELGLDEPLIKKRSEKVLASMLHNYSDLSISTIDKFTHKIIRTFAHDLRLPVNFDVEMDGNNLLSKAIDLLIAKVGTDEKLTKALIEFTEIKADDERNWQIESDLLAFSSHLLKEDGLEHLQKLKNISLEEFFEIRDSIIKYLKQFENKLSDIGKQALLMIDNAGVLHEMFAGGANGIPKYFTYLAETRSDKLMPTATVMKNIDGDKWHAGKATAFHKSNIDSIKSSLLELYNQALDLVNANLKEYLLFRLINQNIYSLMVLNEIEKVIDQFKTENNMLHISEFNKRIGSIVLSEPAPFIYERLGERYRHYLLDEFQDTSILQWQNILPLIDNSLSNGHFNMLVGDGKQSIYRWRGGDVEQFSNLPQIYGTANNTFIKEREASLIRNYLPKVLNNNFRSKAEIVDFNNRFFRKLSADLDSGYLSIYESLEQNYIENNTGGFVSIEFLSPDEEKEITINEKYYSKTLEIIREVQKDGYRLKDIAILCRTNKEASGLAEFLIDQDIDVISSESLLLGKSEEVNFVVTVLQWLQQPSDKVAPARIIQYLIKKELVKQTDLHQAINALVREGFAFFNPFLKDNGYFIKSSELLQMPLYEACEEIIRIFALNKTANPYLQFFMEALHQYVSKNNGHLSNFLEWWEEKKDKKSIVVPQGMNAVNMMTIHKSKGLEFPIVIFPFANWIQKNATDNLWIDLENEQLPGLSSALVPVNKNLDETDHAELYKKEKNKSLLDNFNLLYVAMTRPEKGLYILTSFPSRKNFSSHFVNYLKSIGEWEDTRALYTFGKLESNSSPESLKRDEKENLNYEIKGIISENWKDKLQISRKAPEIWDIEQSGQQQEYGNLMHTALSEINTITDIEKTLDKMLQKGLLTLEEQEKIGKKIKNLITQPAISPFFREGLKIKNEAEILLPDGTTYRPDRVIINKNKAIVIDYKTGKQKETYHKQLEKYGNLLSEMGFEDVEKYLIYTEEEKLERVNSF